MTQTFFYFYFLVLNIIIANKHFFHLRKDIELTLCE